VPEPDDDSSGGSGEVSETARLDPGQVEEPIAPEDATAGYPESESGAADEGTAGPDAPPRHGRPERANESSR
jgi:hypothetical protein